MNTTAAATEARVTVATIRTWCRNGVVAATKQAGRWVIDTASLAHRIAIGTLKTARPTRPVAFTIETLTAIGGSRWTKNGMDRIYFNGCSGFAGLETSNYKTGNIASATYKGESISNSQAYKLAGTIEKLWFDLADGQFHCRYGFSESRVASRKEYLGDVIDGIRAAIAAL